MRGSGGGGGQSEGRRGRKWLKCRRRFGEGEEGGEGKRREG